MTRPANLGAVAAVVQRLAVLLAAGVAPASAWGYLDEGEPAAAIAAAVAAGASISEAILSGVEQLPPRDQAGWRALAAAWAVASDAGSPLAWALRDFAGSLRDLGQAQRDIAVALAAPALTARLVMALPVVGIVFGFALGFNPIGILVGSPLGWACLAVGTSLLLGASLWNRRMVAAAQPHDISPGLDFDLVAIAVSGGGSIDRAVVAVTAARARYLGADDDAWVAGRLRGILDLSTRAGVPAAELLRAEAVEARRDAGAEARERAQALSVRLMLPLGLCVLPSFMVLGVVPLVASVVASTTF